MIVRWMGGRSGFAEGGIAEEDRFMFEREEEVGMGAAAAGRRRREEVEQDGKDRRRRGLSDDCLR